MFRRVEYLPYEAEEGTLSAFAIFGRAPVPDMLIYQPLL
jgi:hypothetical protein